MIQTSKALLLTPAALAGAAVLFYAGRLRSRNNKLLRQIRNTVRNSTDETRAIRNILTQQSQDIARLREYIV